MKKIKNPLVFIVQDSTVYKSMLVGYLQQKKIKNIKTFSSPEECMKALHHKPDIIVLNHFFESITGSELMLKIKQEHPEIDFIFLSGQNDVEVAVNIMKQGAADYIMKNEKAPENLVRSIEHLITATRRQKVRRGFKIGVIGFFILLFLVIMAIILLTIFLEDFKFS
ncbi:MAG: response regulator [Mariniphaga sp.]|jgi:DNA-binding NtrC family response regulator|nr:response regulator [Mariniphaga sp.]